MDFITKFMGREIGYWMELQRHLESSGPKATELFEEVVKLRGKVSFYESRIEDMSRLLPKGK